MNDNLLIKMSLFESVSIIVTVIPWSNTPTLIPLRSVKMGVLHIKRLTQCIKKIHLILMTLLSQF